MKNLGDGIAGILLTLVGFGVILRSLQLEIGRPTEPKPGFIPFLSGVLLTVLSLVLLLRAFRKNDSQIWRFGDLRRPLALVSVAILYILLFDLAGYPISTFILSAMVLRILDVKSGRILLISSAIISIGSYVLLDRIMGVELPSGVILRFISEKVWSF